MKKRSILMPILLAALLWSAALPGGRPLCLPTLFAPAEAAAVGCVSGFVYEAVRSNRIEGATATLYYEDKAGKPVVWDAGASGQQNPQTTDRAGAFRWDVPAGKWRVEIAKEHYEKAYSDWTDAASGRQNIAVPLVSVAAPEVADVIKKRDSYTQEDYITVIFSQYMDRDTINEDTIVFTKSGVPADCEISAADGEVSGASDYVYYARSFDLFPEKGVTELTVKNVRNYAGTKIEKTYRIFTETIRPAVAFTLGDVDGDGAVAPADARLALRASVGLFPDGDASVFRNGARAFLAADCDGSGTIESGDARTILRASVGLALRAGNSPLADYVNLTDKHDDRTHRIDKITLHHMDGVMTAQDCCDYFCETKRQVSANYCIGYDGSIALNVEEQYRAWTSSSEANDMRAITIEMSNDGWDDDRHVSDASLAALIDLCADICLRNGIDKLVYTGDAYGSLTVHKMFIDTDCPGPYLIRKCGYIAAEVNKRLAAQPTQ